MFIEDVEEFLQSGFGITYEVFNSLSKEEDDTLSIFFKPKDIGSKFISIFLAPFAFLLYAAINVGKAIYYGVASLIDGAKDHEDNFYDSLSAFGVCLVAIITSPFINAFGFIGSGFGYAYKGILSLFVSEKYEDDGLAHEMGEFVDLNTPDEPTVNSYPPYVAPTQLFAPAPSAPRDGMKYVVNARHHGEDLVFEFFYDEQLKGYFTQDNRFKFDEKGKFTIYEFKDRNWENTNFYISKVDMTHNTSAQSTEGVRFN